MKTPMKPYKRSKRANGNGYEIRKSMLWRRLSAVVVFVLLATVLLVKALDMQILHSEFFERQGDARQLRTVSIAAHRGDIVDRSGETISPRCAAIETVRS